MSDKKQTKEQAKEQAKKQEEAAAAKAERLAKRQAELVETFASIDAKITDKKDVVTLLERRDRNLQKASLIRKENFLLLHHVSKVVGVDKDKAKAKLAELGVERAGQVASIISRGAESTSETRKFWSSSLTIALK